jgi:hypothetical protein
MANRTKLGIDLSNFTKEVIRLIKSILCKIKTNQDRTSKQHRTWFWNYIWYCKYSYPNSICIKSDNTSGIIGRYIWLLFFTTFYFFYTLPRSSACSGKRTLEILITSVFIS